jgi:hypothetical protein
MTKRGSILLLTAMLASMPASAQPGSDPDAPPTHNERHSLAQRPDDMVAALCENPAVKQGIEALQLTDAGKRQRRDAVRAGMARAALLYSDRLLEGILPHVAAAPPGTLEQIAAGWTPGRCDYLAANLPDFLAEEQARGARLEKLVAAHRTLYPRNYLGEDGSERPTRAMYQQTLEQALYYVFASEFAGLVRDRDLQEILLTTGMDQEQAARVVIPGDVELDGKPIYPVQPGVGYFSYPQASLAQLNRDHPLLAREAESFLGLGTSSLAYLLFKQNFPRGDRSIRELLVAWVTPALARYAPDILRLNPHELYEYIDEHGFSLPAEQKNQVVATSFQERKYLLMWQHFFRHEFEHLVGSRAGEVVRQSGIAPESLAAIERVGLDSLRAIAAQRTKICQSENPEFLEQHPALLLSYLSELEESEHIPMLAGVCGGTRFGRSLRSEIESWAVSTGIVGTVLSSAAIFMVSPQVGLARTAMEALVWAFIGATTAAEVSQGLRSVETMMFDDAMGYLTVAGKNVAVGRAAFQLTIAGVTGASLAALAPTIARKGLGVIFSAPPAVQTTAWIMYGLATFVTVKEFIAAGLNPLLKAEFYADLLAMYVQANAGARVLHAAWAEVPETLLREVVATAILNAWTQNISALVLGEEPRTRLVEFDIQRIWTDKLIKTLVIERGARELGRFLGSAVGAPWMEHAVFTMVSYVRLVWLNKAAVSYFYGTPYWEAWGSFRPRDLFRFTPDDPCAQTRDYDCGRDPLAGQDLVATGVLRLREDEYEAYSFLFDYTFTPEEKQKVEEYLRTYDQLRADVDRELKKAQGAAEDAIAAPGVLQ